VQGIIAARLDTLSDGEKALIRDAAVVGKTAWLGAACEISGASRWEGEELLHALERKQLVRRARRSSVAGEVEFGFTHALTQEVAYSQIARLERAEKHERAAGWVERLSGEREDKAELLAHHYATALDLRRSAGEDTAELVPRARAALAEAGRYAQAVNAHAAAARHLGAALELTAPGDPERPRITLDDATARFRAGLAGQAVLEGALAAQVEAGEW
jgi:predicted ATPase